MIYLRVFMSLPLKTTVIYTLVLKNIKYCRSHFKFSKIVLAFTPLHPNVLLPKDN